MKSLKTFISVNNLYAIVEFKTIIAMVILTTTSFLVFDRLFSPQQIQIILETGQEVTTQGENYFLLSEVLLLIISSFLIGTTATYLFYNSEPKKIIQLINPKTNKTIQEQYARITPLLKTDEKKVFSEIINAKGEILQNKLVVQTKLSKVKITRILANLQRKDMITKERYGFTNKIKLKN